MRIKRQIAALLIVLICSANIVAADGNTFDLNSAIDKAISNAASIKAQDNSYDDLKDSNDKTGKGAMNARDMLNMDERFVYLEQKKDNRTFEEQLEYQGYKLAFGKPMTEEEKLPLLKARDLSPANMTYYMNINKNTRELLANQIRISIYDQYNSLMKLKDSLEIQSRLVQNLEKNNNQAQLKLKLGKLSKSNARMTEISYLKAKLELGKTQRSFDMLLINLNKTLGEPLNKKYSSYSSDNMAVAAVIKPFESYLSAALKNRSEVLNTEIGYKLEKMDYDLTVVAYPLASDIHNKDAKYYLDEAYNKVGETNIDIEIELTSAYSELEKRLKSWENAAELYKLAELRYKEALYKYSQSTITEKELTDSNISFAQAELKLKNSRRDLWMQQLKLDYASSLGPGIRSLAY